MVAMVTALNRRGGMPQERSHPAILGGEGEAPSAHLYDLINLSVEVHLQPHIVGQVEQLLHIGCIAGIGVLWSQNNLVVWYARLQAQVYIQAPWTSDEQGAGYSGGKGEADLIKAVGQLQKVLDEVSDQRLRQGPGYQENG